MKKIMFSWPDQCIGALTSSWDDGHTDDRRLLEILNQYGIKGTWNLNASHLVTEAGKNDPTRIRAEEVVDLYAGHEIATHGFNHPWPSTLSDDQLRHEIINDRIELEKIAGVPVRGHALPFGQHDTRVDRILGECGILYSRSTESHYKFHIPADFLLWHPTAHHKRDIETLWDQFLTNRVTDKLFYLWGHSFEFGREGNWDLIESFGKKVAATEGIWHATNMEVYDYVMAWRSLSWTHDMSAVRNTSAQTIWFKEGETYYSVAGGTTLKLG